MSIIQEALKKIGNISVEAKNTAGDVKKPAHKKTFGLPFYLFVILLILVYFGVRQFSGAGSDPKAGEANYHGLLESIYKPVSSVEARDSEPIQKAPASRKNRTTFPGFVLSGIMQLVDGPRAIINDAMVGVGDVVNGALVQKIDKDNVVLKKKDSEITLGME